MPRNARSTRKAVNRAPGFAVRHVAYGPELGSGIVGASLEQIEQALGEQPGDLRWVDVASQLIPVIPRMRPSPDGFPEPIRVIVDPGVALGFAIDIGPAFINVSAELIRSWGVGLAEVHVQSLGNLVDRARRIETTSIVEGSLGDQPTRWLQTGQSIGSVMVLVPDVVRQVFGSAPAFFLTPMRDLIIGFLPGVDRELAAWLWEEIAVLDPNCLAPIGYRFDGRTISPEALPLPAHLDLALDDRPRSAGYRT